MKLYFFGHDYRYAAEQILLTLFPNERPEYPGGSPEGDRMEIRLSRGAQYITATCALHRGGSVWHGRAAVKAALLDGELLTDRYCQRLIKNAVYRAALASGVQRDAGARAALSRHEPRDAQRSGRPRRRGRMPLCRHSFLPHALRLLQLCQPVRGEKHEAHPAVPRCA